MDKCVVFSQFYTDNKLYNNVYLKNSCLFYELGSY